MFAYSGWSRGLGDGWRGGCSSRVASEQEKSRLVGATRTDVFVSQVDGSGDSNAIPFVAGGLGTQMSISVRLSLPQKPCPRRVASNCDPVVYEEGAG